MQGTEPSSCYININVMQYVLSFRKGAAPGRTNLLQGSTLDARSFASTWPIRSLPSSGFSAFSVALFARAMRLLKKHMQGGAKLSCGVLTLNTDFEVGHLSLLMPSLDFGGLGVCTGEVLRLCSSDSGAYLTTVQLGHLHVYIYIYI